MRISSEHLQPRVVAMITVDTGVVSKRIIFTYPYADEGIGKVP